MVDIQVGGFDGQKIAPLSFADKFLRNVQTLQATFRANKLPVIFIQDCGDIGGAFEKGTPQWEIHPEVAPLPSEKVVQKNSPNAFHETELKDYLDQVGAKTIVVCGLHSEHCFTNTSLSAIELGLEVIVVSDARSTSRKNPNEAQKVIDQQNEILQKRGAIALTADEFKKVSMLGKATETERLIIRRVSQR